MAERLFEGKGRTAVTAAEHFIVFLKKREKIPLFLLTKFKNQI